MFVLKCFTFVLVVFTKGSLSTNFKEENETAQFLWNLSNFAIQSRQYQGKYPHPYFFKYSGKYPQYYDNYPIKSYYGQYPGSVYVDTHNQRPYIHSQNEHYPYDYLPNQIPLYPYRPLGQKLKQSFMDVLLSIARNDDLQCVPKIICEVTSGTISGRQQGVNLPININMESLLGFLTSINGLQSSPLFYFGKAALQGYSSKGNTGSCSYAYPDCPSDPDKLVQYLNNHNGGFFRYFSSGSPQSKSLKKQSEHALHFKQKAVAEQRIQNSPVNYVEGNFREQKGIQFPPRDEHDLRFKEHSLTFPNRDSNVFDNELKPNTNHFFLYKSQNLLKFPEEETPIDYNELPFRKPKELPYDISYYYYGDNDLDLQKPLPNHKASPIIFPIRTGTGELRLDAEELSNSQKPISYQDDDVRITFNRFGGERTEDNFRFTDHVGTHSYIENGRGFSFPSR